MQPWLTIVGIGADGVEALSSRAKALIGNARLVVGGERHLRLAHGLICGERMRWPTPLPDGVPEIVRRRGTPVAVLASGDPYWFGVANLLARHVAVEETICIPAVSVCALACARLGWSSEETPALSLGGRPMATLLPALQPGRRLLALSADARTPAQVAGVLTERGFGASRLHLLEELGAPSERVRSARADAFSFGDVVNLNLLGIEVVGNADAAVIPLTTGRADDLFEHDGQITKREVRAAALAALAPRAGELLWDVGCGSGAIAIEWLLVHPANKAIAIDAKPDRAARAVRNAERLGVPRLEVVAGHAPEVLAGLAAPDAAFIGGGGHDPALLEAVWHALRSGGRIVAHAVTAETEVALLAAVDRHGGSLTRIALQRLEEIGGYRTFRPALPVTQWLADKP